MNQQDGLIRKIILGRDPKDGMAYYVGMRAGNGEVSAILKDEYYEHKTGGDRYIVYLQTDDGVVPWKSVENMPCTIEYDLKF
jgi:hypothetical protein